MLDVDSFKRYNDLHGHAAGDHVLVRISRFLTSQVRADDVVVRIGGDEFLVIITGRTSSKTRELAARLGATGETTAPVAFSLGWAIRYHKENLESTIRRADMRLILVRVRTRHDTPSRAAGPEIEALEDERSEEEAPG